MLAIYKKELKSFFDSPLGYAIIAIIIALISVYFVANNLSSGAPYVSYTLRGVAPIIALAIPILTMRSFSEERKSKTDQMLLTSPIKLYQIVFGKYLAVVTVYAIPLIFSCILPLIIKLLNGSTYFKVDYLTILTTLIFGMVLIAIGVFISSMTESQIISAVVSFLIAFLVIMWSSLTGYLPTSNFSALLGMYVIAILIGVAIYGTTKSSLISIVTTFVIAGISIVSYFIKASIVYNFFHSMIDKFDLISPLSNVAYYNIFDVSGIVFYLSIIAVFLVLTIQGLNKRRWS